MSHYYVNRKAQPATGDHEVHKEGCIYFPSDNSYLGYYSSCAEAVVEAKKTYRRADGCKTCSPECHTS